MLDSSGQVIVHNVSKSYPTRRGTKQILTDVNFTLKKGEKLGILGRNGSGKSTLIRLLSGVENPTTGSIILDNMTLSWPIAFSGAFQGSLTGMDNLRFICRIYNADPEKVLQFTEDFAELGDYLYEPVKSYSSGMRARLAFALSLSIDFDCYLIDEVIAVGDASFSKKCRQALFEQNKEKSLILVSHSAKSIKEYCDRAIVLDQGRMLEFADIDQAYNYYQDIMTSPSNDRSKKK
ncbi:ABC transporter ATP-binding protein [Psittacicella hinzii]|uniref:ABC transporter ATP-binding protein n=1 Tax=Psittacicella hinzii TaxID=2028575 RepID=UPI001FE63E9E|nr:ABC transporter ATP-binding protein [Psittacicella hinzii]